jgi:hypothetical protein
LYRVCFSLCAAIIALLLLGQVAAANEDPASVEFTPPEVGQPASDMATFLNRLMRAESGGVDTAANPRSSALGPFQFIRSTFIDVARRRFREEVAQLSDEELLELRVNRAFARRVAEAYTLENAALLKEQGLEPTLPRLRLAFLLGGPGAARVLKASLQTRLSEVLGAGVLRANPFMVGMTVMHLIRKAAHDVSGAHTTITAELKARAQRVAQPGSARLIPQIVVKCNTVLASCKRWIALRQKKLERTRNAEQQRQPQRHPGQKAAGGKA